MNVLVVAPHPDDEILGVGGTIVRYVNNASSVYVCIVTKGMEPLFPETETVETRRQAMDCHISLGIKETIFLDFPSVTLDRVNRFEINNKILDVIRGINPDEVYIPHWGDMQKDHRIVAEACMVALRPKYQHTVRRVFSYETLSETGWNAPNTQNEFIPNVYVDISEQLQAKLEALKVYQTQLSEYPNSRSIEAVEALAKYRGSMVNVRAAEAFMMIREIR